MQAKIDQLIFFLHPPNSIHLVLNIQTITGHQFSTSQKCCNTLPGGLKLTLKVRIGKNLRRTAALLLQANKLHVKYEGGVGRNDTGVAFAPVGKVRGAGQPSALAYTHLQNMEVLRGCSFFSSSD